MKVRLIKLLEEVRDTRFPPLRRAPLKPAMLYLMELRSQTAEPRLPGQKHVIPVDLLDDSEIPEPVTITHLTSCEAKPELVAAH